MKKTFLPILFVFLAHFLTAQQVWKIDRVSLTNDLTISTAPFTAFTLVISDTVKVFPVVEVNGELIQTQWDNHVENSRGKQAALIVATGTQITLKSVYGLRCQVYFQQVEAASNSIKGIDFRTNCDEPKAILPSIWRAGLANPKPNPIATDTRHIIVHHSASGNGNTNYISLVRNYYVQHTQVNGWNDIGYNYLIAFDGTLFVGRDKQGLVAEQYQVQGAHFCAKNGGTAGVCLIGNFNLLAPSDTMLGTLNALMAWVLVKEQKIATDSAPHPKPTDDYLPRIAGHRQGCATACPGDSVYSLLPILRDETETLRIYCDQIVGLSTLENGQRVVYKDGFPEISYPRGFKVYSLSGSLVFRDLKQLNTGVYLVVFEDNVVQKIQVR